jgi:hypothetical protein
MYTRSSLKKTCWCWQSTGEGGWCCGFERACDAEGNQGPTESLKGEMIRVEIGQDSTLEVEGREKVAPSRKRLEKR